jgi:excisionase family DNA binding protein
LFGARETQTYSTASTALGVGKRRIAQLVQQGKLTAVGLASARRISSRSLRDYLNLPNPGGVR